jgi:hypothetical protein
MIRQYPTGRDGGAEGGRGGGRHAGVANIQASVQQGRVVEWGAMELQICSERSQGGRGSEMLGAGAGDGAGAGAGDGAGAGAGGSELAMAWQFMQ